MKKIETRWLERSPVQLPHYTLCTTPEELKSIQKHLCIPKDDRQGFVSPGKDATTILLMSSEGHSACVVCVREDAMKSAEVAEIVGLLAHEATHVVQFFMDEIGEIQPSREFQANSIQTVTQYLFDLYQKRDAEITKIDGPQSSR